MIVYRCDGCGAELRKGQLRYAVKIEVKAAYDQMEIGLADLVRDHRQALQELIDSMGESSATDIEESVYKHFDFHLCPRCQRAFIRSPLRFHPENAGEPGPVDIDGFLRSLGKDEPE